MAGKASKAKADEEVMIMHPKTRMVDSPDWHADAEDIEVVGLNEPKRRAKPKQATPKQARSRAVPDEGASSRLGVILLISTVALAGVAFALNYLLNSEAEHTSARAERAIASGSEAEAAAGETGEAKTDAAAGEAPADDRGMLETMYRGHVAATAVALGVEAPSTEALAKPAVFSHPISHGTPKVLGPNKSLREGPLSLRVKIVQGLSVDRIKVSSKGQHTLLVVENKGEVPVAYRLLARKLAGAKCLTPAIIRYDAIALDPGQQIEISICSGRQAVEIIDLRTYELSSVGIAWVRQLPPGVVGLDGLTAKAHEVAEGTAQCTEDEEMLQRALYEGELAWEDVIDFYSRHDCTHYPWPSDYRYREGQGPAELPVVAPWNPGASPYDEDTEEAAAKPG